MPTNTNINKGHSANYLKKYFNLVILSNNNNSCDKILTNNKQQ